jgi:hypothetical protein
LRRCRVALDGHFTERQLAYLGDGTETPHDWPVARSAKHPNAD